MKDQATEATHGEVIGCLAHTRSEARARIRQLINERHKTHLVRLPAGLTPVRAKQPAYPLRVDFDKVMTAEEREALAVAALKAGTRFRRR